MTACKGWEMSEGGTKILRILIHSSGLTSRTGVLPLLFHHLGGWGWIWLVPGVLLIQPSIHVELVDLLVFNSKLLHGLQHDRPDVVQFGMAHGGEQVMSRVVTECHHVEEKILTDVLCSVLGSI